MAVYTAYGLVIQSILPLPELVAVADPPQRAADVEIRWGELPQLPEGAGGTRRHVLAEPDHIYLHWDNVGTFLVRAGREIVIDPAPDVEDSLLRLFVLGTTLAVLLHQRGEFAVFHASVVAAGETAVAFIGPKEIGKSTMAAAMHVRGYNLVADDVLAVDVRADLPQVYPGFPYMKLWPQTLTTIGIAPETLPRLRAGVEKRGYRVSPVDLPDRLPLKAVYLLGFGPEISVARLEGKDAMVTLMPHWYGARLGPDVLQELGREVHFQECALLSQKVPVFYLQRPSVLTALPKVAQFLENHLHPLT